MSALREIVVERKLAASPERVFAAWTDARALAVWLAPGEITTEASCDPRVGGGFRLVMRGSENTYVQTGEYLEVDPPRRLVFTWTTDRLPDATTRVSVTLRAVPEGTQLELRHERIPDAPVYEGYPNGWQSILDKLTRHLGESLPEDRT